MLIKKFVFNSSTPPQGISISALHVGQIMIFSPSFKIFLRHFWQKECKHGRIFGVWNVSKQTGHFSKCSDSWLTSTDAILTGYKTRSVWSSFVLFRYQQIKCSVKRSSLFIVLPSVFSSLVCNLFDKHIFNMETSLYAVSYSLHAPFIIYAINI